MVIKTSIFLELQKLEKLYNQAMRGTDIDLPKFYAKLALLELSGWIEESMDEMVKKYSLKKRVSHAYIDNLIKKNYSFDYQKNFREMLVKLLGLKNLEILEKKVQKNKKDELESSLALLKPMRDNHAHTTLQGKGPTPTIWAPTYTLSIFNKVYVGLREYEIKLNEF